MPVLERNIENAAVRYALRCNVLHRKMNGLGSRAWPDQVFLLPKGRTWWVEFKRPGKAPTPLQSYVHRNLRQRGHDVSVLDTVKDFRRELDRRLQR